MERIKKASLVTSLFALALMGLVTGCEKDAFNPNGGSKPLPPAENFFDFNLRGEVQLNVDYNTPGIQALVEVYSENPVEVKSASYVKKEGIKPLFVAFTKDGKLTTKMDIPTAVKDLYLYSDRLGLPICVKLEADATGFSFDATQGTTTKAMTRAGVIGNSAPYQVLPANRNDAVYSLCEWDINGVPFKGYLTKSSLTSTELAGVSKRAQDFLDANKATNGNNEKFVIASGAANLIIPQGGSTVEVTFLGSAGAYSSVLGYYYYPKGQAPKSISELKAINKYIAFPTTEQNRGTSLGIAYGQTAKLLFFSDTGSTDKFPEGYEIGWFFITKGAPGSYGNNHADSYVSKIEMESVKELRNTSFSNDQKDWCQFVSLYDKTSKTLIVGVEDLFGIQEQNPAFGKSDRDFDDALFCVKTGTELDPGDHPEIPGGDPDPEPGTYSIEGTLAFEDIWPDGGDYDLNDVIVEYSREITVDKDNNVTKIKDIFKPVQPEKSALQDNFFACQYRLITDNIPLTLSEGVIYEKGTKSIVVQESALTNAGKTYVIERDMKNAQVAYDAERIRKDFNPYIITKAYATSNRIEIHLPKYDYTTAADASKMNEDNAYYIGGGGIFPFAIDIPIKGFKPVTEKRQISEADQYPEFAIWAKSKGAEETDWYKKGIGAN